MKNVIYEIFIGLNKDKKQVKTFDEFEEIVTKFFKDYKIDFSLNKQFGGYVYEDGTYETEDGVKLTFVGERTAEIEEEFFNELKKIFNQETILVVKKNIESEFVGE